MILLDTHVVVWLYADPVELIPAKVRTKLDAGRLGLSPFVCVELQYLYESKRITVEPAVIIDDLVPKLEIVRTDPPAAAVCRTATGLSWTRDPFDRLLSAEALTSQATLLTKDRTIRKNLAAAWWP